MRVKRADAVNSLQLDREALIAKVVGTNSGQGTNEVFLEATRKAVEALFELMKPSLGEEAAKKRRVEPPIVQQQQLPQQQQQRVGRSRSRSIGKQQAN